MTADAGMPAAPDVLDTVVRPEGRARSVLSVAVATGVGNALVYMLYAAVARLLGPEDYGAFGALAAVGFIASVPAIATQAVVAKQVALRADPDVVVDRDLLGLLRWVNRLGLATTVAVAAAAPALTVFLHLPGPAAPLWLAVWLWPMTLTSAYLGVLQGTPRLQAFAALFLVAGGLRLVGGLAGVVAADPLGAGVAGGLAGMTAGALTTVAVGARLVGLSSPLPRHVPISSPAREVLVACIGLLGIVVLSNVDVVFARHYLPARMAGLYAAGAIVAKCAFWLPQFVGYVAYRDFARLQHRAASVRLALVTVGGIGVLAVGGTALLPRLVTRVTSGHAYTGVAGYVWAFAALGALLACAQLLVYAGIAGGESRLHALVWAAVVVESTLLATTWHGSIRQVVSCALVVNGALAIAATVATRTSLPVPARRGLGGG